MSKERIDKLLVELGHFSTRAKAQEAIKQGRVFFSQKQISKTSELFDKNEKFEIRGEDFVGRGALKLKKALEEFQIDCTNLTMMDVGASTGGFSEILIQSLARKVYAVDVGDNQLDQKLKNHEKIINLEKTHILELHELPELMDGFVMDVSFISVLKIFSHLKELAKPDAWVVSLIKPQFEVGREALPKDGVVKDQKEWERVKILITDFIKENNWTLKGWIESPVLGKTGNKEFFCYFKFQNNI